MGTVFALQATMRQVHTVTELQKLSAERVTGREGEGQHLLEGGRGKGHICLDFYSDDHYMINTCRVKCGTLQTWRLQ